MTVTRIAKTISIALPIHVLAILSMGELSLLWTSLAGQPTVLFRLLATGQLVSWPDPTHSNEEKGLVFFEQFLGLSSEFWEANQNRSM